MRLEVSDEVGTEGFGMRVIEGCDTAKDFSIKAPHVLTDPPSEAVYWQSLVIHPGKQHREGLCRSIFHLYVCVHVSPTTHTLCQRQRAEPSAAVRRGAAPDPGLQEFL